jgi:serine/threonine protein kinase
MVLVSSVPVQSMELVAGAHVTPGLRLVRLLAEGGMGHVWVADHLALDIQVAVKFVRSNVVRQDPTLLDRFHREAQAATRIKSPHVVQIFDHGSTADGLAYIVMELLEGETLAARLSTLGPFGVADALSVAEQTAGVLEKAHSLGIVHRDIKPENLFLTDVGQQPFLKVLDFGLAKFKVPGSAELTMTGALLGTPAYMSPEQLRNSKYTTELGDLWALAVTLYKVLSGRLPFEAATPAGVAVAVCTLDFVPISQYRAGLPAGLSPWFARALAKDPHQRFADAHEFVLAFADALGVTTAQTLEITRGLRACLSDEEILEMVEGRLSDREMTRIERHLDRCVTCCELVGAALAGEASPALPRGLSKAASGPFEIGSVLANRYRLERWLGKGTLGSVYDATDLLLAERVALKTIPVTTDERVLRELLKEVRLARRVEHPNVCPIYDVGLYEEQRGVCLHFVTMAFVEGEILRSFLRRSGALPRDRAVALLRELLLGLCAAHRVGLVHRDVRPESIVLVESEQSLRPVLLDLGLAAVRDRASPSGCRAPELAQGAVPDAALDLFACGAIALELLGAGAALAGAGPLLDLPALPSDLREVIERCLGGAGRERYTDAGSVLEALDRTFVG